MRNTFQRCAARMVLTIPLAAFSIASVSAGPILGSDASTFAILGGGGVTINGTGSVITGSVGAYPTTSVTACCASYTISGGTVQSGGATASGAQSDLTTAINALDLLGPGIAETLAGPLTLGPGVYTIGTSLAGTITLDGGGNSNALWVFLEPSSLTTAPGSVVQVENVGSGAGVGVYWVMTTSATLGGGTLGSTFYGNVLANQSISLTGTGGVTDSCGSLLTQVASVTLAGRDTVGIGCAGGGTLTGTTITPYASSVPEPGTFFFVAPGLAGLLFLRKRSR